jgi:uracil-DNA glycosylase family 4
MSWDEDIYTCSVCGREDLVLASGPRRADILVVGEFPGREELRQGRPMVGGTGGVLRKELGKAGLDLRQMRVTNLWLHPPQKVTTKSSDEIKEQKQKCFQYGLEKLIEEAKGRKAILLLGSDTVKELCNEKVSDVSGLEVKSIYLSAPLIFACVQPATVFHGGIGELRQALQKFRIKVDKL